MSVVKEYYKSDKDGRKRVQELKTGVIVEFLEEPSADYLAKLEASQPAPQWEYLLTSEKQIALDLQPTTLLSKTFRFSRELTAIEESVLEKNTNMTVKTKRQR